MLSLHSQSYFCRISLDTLISLNPLISFTTLKRFPNATIDRIQTSKYTLLTFVPKNLFEQFRRLANSFFLLLIVLQAFDLFNTIPVEISAIPLIAIVALTALKDAFEDYKRWTSDTTMNARVTHILGGSTWVNYNYPNKREAPSWSDRALKMYVHCFDTNSQLSVEKIRRFWLPNYPTPSTPFSSDTPIPSASTQTSINVDSGDLEKPMEPESNDRFDWLPVSWESIRVGDIIRFVFIQTVIVWCI